MKKIRFPKDCNRTPLSVARTQGNPPIMFVYQQHIPSKHFQSPVFWSCHKVYEKRFQSQKRPKRPSIFVTKVVEICLVSRYLAIVNKIFGNITSQSFPDRYVLFF